MKAEKRGNLWRVQICVDGQRMNITGATKKEAIGKATAIKTGVMEYKQMHRMTVADAIDDYIESAILAPATCYAYRNAKKALPKIMELDINAVTEAKVQKALKDYNHSENTAKLLASVICVALDAQGVRLNKRKIRIEPDPPKEQTYLQPDEVPKLLEAAKGTRYYVPIMMGIFLGMRKSEVLGLQWNAVDFEHKTITIKTILSRSAEKGSYLIKQGAKSRAGNRTIECPDIILNELNKLERVDDLVFHIPPSRLPAAMKHLCKKAGVTTTTFHGLRHTNAAIMHFLGVSDLDAIRRNGWSSVSIYHNLYAYAFKDDISKGTQAMLDYANSGGENFTRISPENEKVR